jgi:hypothetical protein
MAMQYDVKAATVVADGSVYGARTRVKGLVITPTAESAGSVVLKDGGSGGTARLTINIDAGNTGGAFPVVIPGEGIVFDSSVYADLTTVTSVTVFYG